MVHENKVNIHETHVLTLHPWCQHLIRAYICVLVALVLTQFPANGLGNQWMVAQGIEDTEVYRPSLPDRNT